MDSFINSNISNLTISDIQKLLSQIQLLNNELYRLGQEYDALDRLLKELDNQSK